MAVDMFMKFTDVKGESKGKGHEKEIDVLSWSSGMKQPIDPRSGQATGKMQVAELNFAKYLDAATTDLWLACLNGKVFSEVILTVQKAGESALPYFKITLTNVRISSYSTGGHGTDERLTENASLRFQKIKGEYDTQTEKGAKGEHFQVGWDIGANVKV